LPEMGRRFWLPRSSEAMVDAKRKETGVRHL